MNPRLFAVFFAAVFLALASLPQPAAAAGTYKFCGKWSYRFDDQGMGEDFLTYTGASGSIAASHTWGSLSRNGTEIWSGYMDTAGCTGTVTATAGTYAFQITGAIAANGRNLWVYPDHNKVWRWFSATYNLPGQLTNAWTYTPAPFGVGDETASVAAVMVHIDNQTTAATGLVTSGVYELFANDPCPTGPGACYNPPDKAVYIGDGMAFKKTVIAHEFGHKVQTLLIGTLPFYAYTYNSSADICACNHLPANENSHCLQSREHIGAAFMEGFGHFYAASLYNDPSQAGGEFTYYKKIWASASYILPEGWPISLSSPVKWMESNCNSNGRGTEFDWLEFLYDLHTVSANKFSFAHIDELWSQACGGDCVYTGVYNDTIWWAALSQAADAHWGATSAKATFFRDTADTYGVNW